MKPRPFGQGFLITSNMNSLTDKQSAVLQSIIGGSVDQESIVKTSGVAKQGLNTIINALIKKGLIIKMDDDTYQATEQTQSLDEIADSTIASNEKQTDDSSKQINEIDPADKTLVIPYVKLEASSEMLKLALRSWIENFNEYLNLVVVGDASSVCGGR